MTKRVRIIPVLTVDKEKLVKTVKFKKPNYIGDPINAVKIFNEKEVDEIVLLDITATKQNREPNFAFIEEICSEAFMPFAYGGGITKLKQIEKLFKLGIEKVVLNSCIDTNFNLITEASNIFGSQSIVISLDLKKNIFGKYQLMKKSGSKKIQYSLEDYIKKIEEHGAGEIFLNVIDRDGTYLGYECSLIQSVSNLTTLPVVACGGANSNESFKNAILSSASAVAAGSLFVYRGKTNGILINYPSQEQLRNEVFNFI
jgi:cyclase